MEINDPKKYKKFDKLLAEQRKLVHSNELIAESFALEQNNTTKHTKVTKLRKKTMQNWPRSKKNIR